MTMRPDAPDLSLDSRLFTTLDRSNSTADAVAIKNGVFTAVGRSEDVMPLADANQDGGALGRRTHSRCGNGAFGTLGGGYASAAMGTRYRRLLRRGNAVSAATAEGDRKLVMNCSCANACTIHGHNHVLAWSGQLPISDLKLFWRVLRCACGAI
jgi:hypothetical protein